MPGKGVVILDGAGHGDKDLSPILKVLAQALQADGARIETFPPMRNGIGPLCQLL
jgi:hypothetical protein